MSLKLKAALETLLFFAVAVVCGIAVGVITNYLSPKAIMYVGAAMVFSVFVYLIYQIRLTMLEFNERKK